MSGITPLLDTLLHQVLGKRIDTAPPRDLTEPVRPVDPGEGPRALHSDSRLDGRRPAAAPLQGASTNSHRGEAPASTTGVSSPPASFQTHFSPSARTIADLLVRFPAPPSVLSSSVPLVGADESPNATTLAGRLQAGVRDSGLFYEAHLSRWYRGEMSRQQLEREPQMMQTLRFSPASQPASAPAAGTTTAGAAAPAMPGATGLPAQGGAGLASLQPGATVPLPNSSQAAAAQAAGSYASTEALLPGSGHPDRMAPGAVGRTVSALREASAPGQLNSEVSDSAGREAEQAMRSRTAGEPVHESLQGLVRHQLEMLVAPVLRWEGDVWSGIFMALMIQLPAGARREGEGDHKGDEEEGNQEAWHSELKLSVPSLGELGVAFWLQESNLRMELKARDDATLATLRQGMPQLEQRLRDAGLSTVLIDARLWREDLGEGWQEGEERYGFPV